MIKNEKIDLAILLLTALILSTYLFFRTYVISIDGVSQYIPMAKVFASGFFTDAIRSTGQQPLYSFLIAFLSRWVPDFEIAGKLVSSFFGIMVIFPVYFSGKRIFDRKVAFLSAFLLVIHPYVRRFSADVLKESPYLFLLAAGIWFSLRTFEKDKIYPYILIPFLSAMAYLIRPDGVEILLAAFFYILFVKIFSAPGKKWVVILFLLLASCVLLFPYLFHLREITGEWNLSKAKSIIGILGWGVAKGEIPFITKVIYSLKKLNLEIFAIYHPLFIFLLALGLLRKIYFHFKNEEKYLISFFALHYLVLFLMIFNLTEWRVGEKVQEHVVSGRHMLPLLLFSIYWVGEGFITTCEWVCKKTESILLFHRLTLRKQSIIISVTLLVLISAIVLPKTLKPQRYERLPEKWAGIWIKSQFGKGMIIFTTAPRVAYYADGNFEYIDFDKDKFEQIKTSMAEKKAIYLAIQGREIAHLPQNEEAVKKDLVELARFGGKGMEEIIVYERVH